MSDLTLLSELEKTGLLPLWGRKYWHEHLNVDFQDKFALKVVADTPYDFSNIDKAIGDFGLATWGSRSIKFDSVTQDYLKKYPKGWVLNFGVGLDDPFGRMDNGQAIFLDYDYAPVLDYREKYIVPNTRRIVCRKSFLDNSWIEILKSQNAENPLLLLSGVSMYLTQGEIFGLLRTFFREFPNGECHFDALSPYGVNMLNKGMEKSKMPKQRVSFGLKKVRPLEQLLGGEYNINLQSIFEKDVVKTVSLWTRTQIWFCDVIKLSNFISIRYEK